MLGKASHLAEQEEGGRARRERETRFRQQAFPSIPLAEMLSFVRRKKSDLFETWSSNLHVAVWKTFS